MCNDTDMAIITLTEKASCRRKFTVWCNFFHNENIWYDMIYFLLINALAVMVENMDLIPTYYIHDTVNFCREREDIGTWKKAEGTLLVTFLMNFSIKCEKIFSLSGKHMIGTVSSVVLYI